MKKTIILFIMTVFMIASLITFTLAASYNVKITLKDVTSANIEQGQSITFVIKLSNIDAGDGIGAVSGKFEYDTNVFEEIKAADIVAGSGWGSISYNDQNDRRGEFVTERAAGDIVSEDNDLMEITAKVKENAVLGRTEIKISNISASNGNEDIEISDVKAAITIVDAYGNSISNNTVNNSINNSLNNTANNAINNTANNTIKNTVNNNTGSTSGIPSAGIEDYFVPSIMILIVVAFISFIQYKKVKSI